MPIQIREATAADTEAIVALKRKLVSTWFDDPDYLDSVADYPARLRERVQEFLGKDEYYYVVAYDGDRPVACMSASIHKALPGPDWSGVSAHVGDLYVEEDYRGQHIAARLMELCMAWCRQQKAFRASMHATRMALPMYLKQGWQPPRREEDGGAFQSLDYYFDEE